MHIQLVTETCATITDTLHQANFIYIANSAQLHMKIEFRRSVSRDGIYAA